MLMLELKDQDAKVASKFMATQVASNFMDQQCSQSMWLRLLKSFDHHLLSMHACHASPMLSSHRPLPGSHSSVAFSTPRSPVKNLLTLSQPLVLLILHIATTQASKDHLQ
mmetsp:Transcript_64751/g.154640  ORF Transcript_64751/g.154640 Transcript_64751/m.154640 type:complete len:110 (+) Transcript_64751:157-486(+)